MANQIERGKKQLKSHKPENKPFYTSTPQVPSKKIAGEALYQNSSLGGNIPGMVPEKPGQSTGFGGAPQKRPAHGYGHPNNLKIGPLRMSGNKGAHRIGGLKAPKLTVK